MKAPDNMKFFIVDDDPFSRMLYQQHLLNMGFKNNVLFDNGADCINRLSMLPDVVMLDYDMKPFNGLEVLQMIKKYNPYIHLFMVSSVKDKQVASEAIKHGAVDYIVKGERDLEMISKVLNRIMSGQLNREKIQPFCFEEM